MKELLFKIWPAILGLILALVFSGNISIGSVLAQTEDPSQLAKKYGVSFPIIELGGCTDYASCRNYCEDPVHKDACVSFAKAKGFYKEDATTIKAKSILEAAKLELGCDSYDSCKNYCEDNANRNKCDGFAKLHKLVGGHVDNPAKEEVIKKAQEILGCNSAESCKSYCSQAQNQQKCSEFAKSTGLRGGELRKGPGGCSSEETCKAFCSDPKNFNVCTRFTSLRGGIDGQFRGPGGCSSKEACESYCANHPQECSRISETTTAPLNPKEFVDFCRENPDKCQHNNYCEQNPIKCQKDFISLGVGEGRSDMGNCKTPGECYDWCKANLGKCQGFNSEAPRPDDRLYKQYVNTNYDPEAACKRGGCNWTSGNCQCPSSGYNYNTAYQSQQYGGSSMSREQQESTCRAGGGSCDWRDNTCYCQGYRAPTTTTSGSSSTYSGNTSYSSGSYSGNTMSREQQESTCRAGGGTCDWSSGTCNCRGYTTPTSGSTSTSTTTTSGSNMSREQQESGCSSCGGTCNWSGDMCQCQCSSTSTQTQTSTQTPPPTTAESQPTQTQPQSSPAVQGISTGGGLLQIFLDWLNSL